MNYHIVLGKPAERIMDKQLRTTSHLHEVFGPQYRDFVSPLDTFLKGTRNHLKNVFLIPKEDTSKALKAVCDSWEQFFITSVGLGAPCWVPIYQCLHANVVRVGSLLQPSGRKESTAVYQETLMARVSPLFLVGLALLDGAILQLSHTHQKDVVLRLSGIRTEITIAQLDGTCVGHLEFNTDRSLSGTYPVSSDYEALLSIGQSWTSPVGLTSDADIQQALRWSGFCGAEHAFLSLGFLRQQIITLPTAIKYLNLATQAYESALISFDSRLRNRSQYNRNSEEPHATTATTTVPGSNGPRETDSTRTTIPAHLIPPEGGQIPLHSAASREFCTEAATPRASFGDASERERSIIAAMIALRELMSADYFDKMGRPNSRRLDAQLKAIHAHCWVAFLISPEGASERSVREDQPVTTSDISCNMLRSTDDDAPLYLPATLSDLFAVPVEGRQDFSEVQAHNHSSAAVSSQAATAWLTCWSICRVLVNVQVLPGFIGNHGTDKACWLG